MAQRQRKTNRTNQPRKKSSSQRTKSASSRKTRSTSSRRASSRRTSRSSTSSSQRKSTQLNAKAQWAAFHELQKQIEKAWTRLRNNVKKGANVQTLTKDRNQLLLLLGECNYMARECKRMQARR